MPQRTNTDIRRLVRNAQMNTMISKIIMSVFILVFGIMMFLPLRFGSSHLGISYELTIVGTVSAFLAALLFLIVIMGLQVSTSFFSSGIIDILSPLPLTKQDVSSIALLCFIRIFDLPLAIATAAFPVIYIVSTDSIMGGLAALFAVGVTEVFALALCIGLARLFYSRINTGSGRSKWRALLRVVLMLVWILPSFGAYVVINFSMEIIQFFTSLTQTIFALSYIVMVLFPFSYGFLVSQATFIQQVNYNSLAVTLASSFGYLAVAVYLVKWVARTIRSIGAGGIVTFSRHVVTDTLIRPQVPWLGIIRKDLRIASRTPSYASIFFLPAVQTIILAFSFSAFDKMGLTETLGFLTGMSLMTILIPPTLFSIEGLASAYTRSLPLQKRTLIFSKTLLATLTFILSLLVILVATLYMAKDPILILAFGCAHTFAVASANMLEILLLAEKFWKEGFAIGNIYARLSTYVLIMIPALIVVLAPIFVAIVVMIIYPSMVLPIFFAIALLEFLSVVVVTFLTNRRRRIMPRF